MVAEGGVLPSKSAYTYVIRKQLHETMFLHMQRQFNFKANSEPRHIKYCLCTIFLYKLSAIISGMHLVLRSVRHNRILIII